MVEELFRILFDPHYRPWAANLIAAVTFGVVMAGLVGLVWFLERMSD